MKTITIKTYKFEELNEEAKKVAREWWKKDGLDEHECEAITETFQYMLEELGLPDDDVRWNLSCCQGDGVAFYGELDIAEYVAKNKIKTKFRKLFDRDGDLILDNFTINKSQAFHFYNHWNTMNISWNEDLYNLGKLDNPTRHQAIEDFVDHVISHIRELSKEFEKSGYESIDFYSSDDYVDECIVANEYDFLEDGNFLS